MKSIIDKFEKHKFLGLLRILCLATIFAGIGAVILLFEGSDIVRRYSLVWDMNVTEGTVQRVEVRGPRKSRSYHVVVSYAVDSGHGGRTVSGIYRQRLPFLVPSPGEAVTIAYDPGEPNSIEPLAIEFFGVAIAVVRLLVLPILTCLMAVAGAVCIYVFLSLGIDYERRMAAFLFSRARQFRMTPLVERSESRPPPDLPPPIWKEQGRLSPDDDAGQPRTRQP